MPLSEDILIGTQDLINLFIDGYDSPLILGMKDRLDNEYPAKNITVMSKHPAHRLPNEIGIKIPLEHPILAIYDLDADIDELFHKHRLPNQTPSGSPSTTNKYGWLKEWTVQFDIFARTIPETRNISDTVEAELVDFCQQIWDNLRIRMRLIMPFYGLMTTSQLEAYHKYARVRVSTFQKKE
jgi:hypothetical protein